MKEFIENLKKFSEFANDTIKVYKTLEERLDGVPEAKQVIVPLVYKHMVEYNKEHQVIDHMFLAMAGPYLAVRYKGLQEFFGIEEGAEQLKILLAQVSPYLHADQMHASAIETADGKQEES